MAIANKPKQNKEQVLGGLWLEQGLNKNLMARIRPIIEESSQAGQGHQAFNPDPSEPVVAVLLEDADFATESQYSTPFESSNPEGRLPNLMGMIQSGQMASAAFSFMNASNPMAQFASDVGEAIGFNDMAKSVLEDGAATLEGLKGRSNFTKINSRQIYTSSSSIRITATLVLQAWNNAAVEVEAVLNKLQQWSVAKKLSQQSLIVGLAENELSEALFPSEVPPIISLSYGGTTYSPLVIETVAAPITAPMTANGDRISVKAQITFVSLMAWDKQDIKALRG